MADFGEGLPYDAVLRYNEVVEISRRPQDFCSGKGASSIPDMPAEALEYFGSPEFDELLVRTVTSVFPEHEHDAMVERHRGLVGAWVADQR